MSGYFQIDRQILNSTIWVGTDSDTKTLWFFLLLVADIKTGIVSHTIPAIVRDTGICREKVDMLLDKFSSPDPDSRSKEYDGRRIMYVDGDNPNGGITILNYDKYRRKHDSSSAERVRRHRERKRNSNGDVTLRNVTETKEKENKKEKELINLPDSKESVSSQIFELEKRYSLEKELLTEIRNSCALSRKNGKMADSVWLNTLRRIEKYPIEAVLDAGSEYVEKYADGSRSEAYFVAVVAGKAKNGAKSVASGTKRTDLVNAKEMLKRIEKGMYPAHEVEDMKRTGEIARWEKIVSESEQ